MPAQRVLHCAALALPAAFRLAQTEEGEARNDKHYEHQGNSIDQKAPCEAEQFAAVQQPHRAERRSAVFIVGRRRQVDAAKLRVGRHGDVGVRPTQHYERVAVGSDVGKQFVGVG